LSKGEIFMNVVCLDLEGVLVPEIWIAFAEASGIPELKRTTRDEPDYNKLMNWRLSVLRQHGLGIKEIQDTIAKIDPLPGAKEFLDELRSLTQVIIISDTFTQFAAPLMKKLGMPTIFCNSLVISESGEITDFKMRIENSKYTTVKALHAMGFETIAAGDSYNDLGMINASKAGFLFRSTDKIKADNPHLSAYEKFDDLLAAIKEVL
jgi:phosphoserine/homoserine phosphotransferase